ncbi:MAG: hypothetical protein MUP81_04515 [Dehalococcoidia bacterium]|nr:hypothetical protein [Dehalococcoidia bacterium]
MGKSPGTVQQIWQWGEKYETLPDLVSDLPAWIAAPFNNYLLIWAKEIDGLTAAAELPGPSEAEIAGSPQSVKSESVIKEAKDIGDVDKILKRIGGEGALKESEE